MKQAYDLGVFLKQLYIDSGFMESRFNPKQVRLGESCFEGKHLPLSQLNISSIAVPVILLPFANYVTFLSTNIQKLTDLVTFRFQGRR